jgi:SNF family Na+-dependent transporter
MRQVVYVTVTFPYIILLVLLIRYATLESSAYLDGLRYYVTPNWQRLASAQVWADAASQLFFSLGLSQGGLIAMASYNRFHYDIYRYKRRN